MITIFAAAAVMIALEIAFMIAAAAVGWFVIGTAVSIFYIVFSIACMAAGFALLFYANSLFNELVRLQGQRNEIADSRLT